MTSTTDSDQAVVLVVDFGAQYAQLIARRVREAHVYSEICSRKITAAEIKQRNVAVIILSGGPKSVHEENAPMLDPEIYDLDILKKKLSDIPSMEGLELSSKVTCEKAYYFGNENSTKRVSVIDFGAKTNILRSLAERNCYLKVFPMHASLDEIMDFKPDGIMLTNGPGDPGAMPKESELVKQLVASNKPVFGICLGHQLLAQSQGISTYKMHAGHRGINHPVINLISGKSEITSQNHGFTVNGKDINNNPEIEITHKNLNDNTIEAIRSKNKKVFSVQYHPESNPGPHDSRYLFDEFVASL